MRTRINFLLVVLFIMTGCVEQSSSSSNKSLLPGWKKIFGDGVLLWVPAEYQQLDLHNLSMESEKIRKKYPNLADIYNDIDDNSAKVSLWAINFETGDNIFIYPNTNGDDVEAYMSQRETAFDITKTIILTHSKSFGGTKGVFSSITHQDKVWNIYASSEETQYLQIELIFDQIRSSIQTIR